MCRSIYMRLQISIFLRHQHKYQLWRQSRAANVLLQLAGRGFVFKAKENVWYVLNIIILLTEFEITWATRWMSHVEQDLLTLPEHLRSPSFWWGSCCLVFSFLGCVLCTIVCLFVFFFSHHDFVTLFLVYEFECPSGIFRPSFIRIKVYKYI